MVLKVRGLIVTYDVSIVLPMVKPRDELIKKRFGERVRELRKQKELSQETLAGACDLDRTYIGGVERGERNVSLINIHIIARALGVSVKDLF
jgi:DNA-binding XRE family transcriptional regulator